MLLHSLSPPVTVRTVTRTASLCLIRLVPRRRSRCCERLALRNCWKVWRLQGECCWRDRWHFACYETMQLITTLPRVFTHTAIRNRWRSIMWLKGTAAVSRLFTIRELKMQRRWHRVAARVPDWSLVSFPLCYCMWKEFISKHGVPSPSDHSSMYF